MPVPVELPKLGNTVEECIIAKWVKHSGDQVAVGDTVLEVETDKAVQEIASPASGSILATFFSEGDLVPVFTNLFVIGEPGENVDSFRPKASGGADTGSDRSKPLIQNASSAPPLAIESHASEVHGVFSPRARRFSQEHDFHPAEVRGSGAGGRVVERDLRELYLSSPGFSGLSRKQMASGAKAPAEGSGIGRMVLSSDLGTGASTSKLSHIRNRIAQRMRESMASTAQYTLHSWADASGLLTLRARIKASSGLPQININDIVMYCTVQALLAVPDLNVEFLDGRLVKHSKVHLGFAVDTPRGLMVPVVRDADRLSMGEMASSAKELAARAVQGSIAPDDLTGATFSVSNLGGLGIESFTPILNPPQVAILGINAIQIKPVRRDGVVQFIDAIGLSLTLDHQIIDGAPGARFLLALKEKIEKVELLCGI